jgi:hypothetical protein
VLTGGFVRICTHSKKAADAHQEYVERLEQLLDERLLLIPAQRTKGTDLSDLVVSAPWKRPYQARLPIGGRVAACGPGNFIRRVGSSGILPMPWG